jgi:hypothetical protein
VNESTGEVEFGIIEQTGSPTASRYLTCMVVDGMVVYFAHGFDKRKDAKKFIIKVSKKFEACGFGFNVVEKEKK